MSASDQPILGEIAACVSRASFWRPGRIVEPTSWIEHIPFAYWLVTALRPQRVVELGTFSGNSFFAFCEAVARNELPTRLTAIDTWAGDQHTGAYGDGIFVDFNRHRIDNFATSTDIFRGLFDDARQGFAEASIDLLHIDGLHTYEAVRHDFETWRGAMSGRGVILFHDIAVRQPGFGVWKLWEEICGQHPSFGFMHGNGLGVLGVGSDLPSALHDLFRLPAEAADTLRILYHRLGQSVVDWEPEVSRLRRRLSAIETSSSWRLAELLANVASHLRPRPRR